MGHELPLAFALTLAAGVLITSALRGRSVSEVLRGITSQTGTQAEAGQAIEGNPPAPTMSPGGGTRGAQKIFARHFAADTGLSLGIVERWLLAEQPPGSPSAPGSNNWLNVQYTSSGPNAEYWRIARLPVRQAAAATAAWMRKNQPSIAAAAGKGSAAEEAAIVNSGWAGSHYWGHL
jgi:hypothetical protein